MTSATLPSIPMDVFSHITMFLTIPKDRAIFRTTCKQVHIAVETIWISESKVSLSTFNIENWSPLQLKKVAYGLTDCPVIFKDAIKNHAQEIKLWSLDEIQNLAHFLFCSNRCIEPFSDKQMDHIADYIQKITSTQSNHLEMKTNDLQPSCMIS